MSLTGRSYLLNMQYRDASNLAARIALHERFSTNREDEYRWLFDQFDLPPRAGILELGCGPGTVWRKNLDRLLPGWSIILTDFSLGMLAEAKSSLPTCGHPFRVLRVDAQWIPFANESFEAVIADYMLYHVPNLSRALTEIQRVLKPGGRLFAATNGMSHMRELKEMIEGIGLPPSQSDVAHDVPGFRLDNGRDLLSPYFPEIELRRRENGLVVTDVEPLIAYLGSTKRAHDVLDTLGLEETKRRLSTLRVRLERQLDRDGAIRITKDSGLFVARRERGGCW